jgi:hypothetical protein
VELNFRLIEDFLDELGVSQEDFAKACEAAVNRGGESALIFNKIMSCDDFASFKVMMVKRNQELELEVIECAPAGPTPSLTQQKHPQEFRSDPRASRIRAAPA